MFWKAHSRGRLCHTKNDEEPSETQRIEEARRGGEFGGEEKEGFFARQNDGGLRMTRGCLVHASGDGWGRIS